MEVWRLARGGGGKGDLDDASTTFISSELEYSATELSFDAFDI